MESAYVLPADVDIPQLIIDMHTAEGTVARVPFHLRDSVGMELRSRIALKHGISGEELEEMMLYLQTHPEINGPIYDTVISRLGKTDIKSDLE